MNLPPGSVRDLVIHQDDLVIATFGRSFWILDDMTPLRQIDSKVAASSAFLYKPATAIRMNRESFQGTPLPPEIPKTPNPPDGAILDYYLQSAASEVTLEILDSQNQIVRRYSSNDPSSAARTRQAIADIWIVPPPHLTARAGMNRFVWDLRYSIAAAAGEADDENGMAAQGPQVLPGMYQVRLSVGGSSSTRSR